jgi:uncharacterized damage-inducible protein DinB
MGIFGSSIFSAKRSYKKEERGMASKEMLLTLYAYNDWANQRILDAAEKVADADLATPALEGQRSLQELLFHVVRAEWLWRNLIQHRARPDHPPRIEDVPDLAALRTFSQEEARHRQTLLAQLSEEELGSTVQVVDGSGKASPLVLWHMLMQPILHGVQHRSEAALILTGLGQSPGDIDFIFFV